MTAGPRRVSRRILAAGLPCVPGHADFEAQNLRWHAREEALHGGTPVCRDALRAQAAERLRRANAKPWD